MKSGAPGNAVGTTIESDIRLKAIPASRPGFRVRQDK